MNYAEYKYYREKMNMSAEALQKEFIKDRLALQLSLIACAVPLVGSIIIYAMM
jgi:hypothetical protein